MLGKLSTLGAMTVLALGLVAVAGGSYAQYPAPGEGVTIEASDTTVDEGGTTILTCTAYEEDGSPAANAICTFTIVSEPDGSDSALGSKTVTKVTNAQGVATASLYVGTVPGVLVIEAESDGAVSSILISIEDDGTAPSPPQAPIGNIQPPSTGSGGLAD